MSPDKILWIGLSFFFLSTADAQNWDINIARHVNPRYPGSNYWKTTSGSAYFISAAIPVGFLTAAVIKGNKNLNRKASRVLGSIITEVILTETAKRIINRKRPAESYPAEIFPYRHLQGRSFPSGHTSLAFAVATSVSLDYPKWYVVVPSFLWAGSVGYSRIYLGVHYPSDVISGALAGIGSACLSKWINRKIFKK